MLLSRYMIQARPLHENFSLTYNEQNSYHIAHAIDSDAHTREAALVPNSLNNEKMVLVMIAGCGYIHMRLKPFLLGGLMVMFVRIEALLNLVLLRYTGSVLRVLF